MYPPPFGYIRVSSVEDAINSLSSNEDAKILAGGQSLIPLLKLRLARPSYIIDINGIKSLSYIKIQNNEARIGALIRHHEIEVNEELWKACPSLPEAAAQIGDPQVRNMGTMAGSLAHADPSADWPIVLASLNARAVIIGPNGERTENIDSLLVGPFATTLSNEEMIKEIIIPLNRKSAYVKLERKAGDFAVVSVAASIEVDMDGSIINARIFALSSGSMLARSRSAEETLIHKGVNAVEEAANNVANDIKFVDDARGSAVYKRKVITVVARKAIQRALSR